jgi:hypothetical protein
MIEINYLGRFGNQLFQYAIGRIISEKKNLSIISGNYGDPEEKEISIFKSSEQEQRIIVHDNPLVIRGFKLDYDEIFEHSGKYILYGYFQDYENILPYKDFIKSLYNFEKKKDLYRLTDYYTSGGSLDMDYYMDVIEQSQKIPVIYTDDSNNPCIQIIKDTYNCKVHNNSSWIDFVELSSYKHICISQSSFSWWAAWLSNAEKIYYPLSSKKYWQHRNDGNDVNLVVTDEDRYIYI